jgi:hypothetical protein
MPTDGIRVEGNEQNVTQLAWNQGQARIRIVAADRLAKDEHVILNRDKWMAQWFAKVMIDLGERLSVDQGRVKR